MKKLKNEKRIHEAMEDQQKKAEEARGYLEKSVLAHGYSERIDDLRLLRELQEQLQQGNRIDITAYLKGDPPLNPNNENEYPVNGSSS